MVTAPNGLNKAPKPKPTEPVPMTGVIHIGNDISKIERADSPRRPHREAAKRSYFSLEEEFGPRAFSSSTARAPGSTSTPVLERWRRIRTCTCWSA